MTPPLAKDIAIVGATGRLGRLLVARAIAGGHPVRAVGRRPEALETLVAAGVSADRLRVADIDRPETLRPALEGAGIVIDAAHARFAGAILACLPPDVGRFVVLGSTRRFIRFPDAAARSVIAAEELLAGQNAVDWTMLHPTMIYGAAGENNLGRIARLVRVTPVVPLPGGGRSAIQPIHVGDVADATMAAAFDPGMRRKSAILTGPAPVAYADLVRAVANAVGRRVAILPVPYPAMQLAAFGLRLASPLGLPRIEADEIRRLLEDKAFDATATTALLGRPPRSLADGLAETFGTGPKH